MMKKTGEEVQHRLQAKDSRFCCLEPHDSVIAGMDGGCDRHMQRQGVSSTPVSMPRISATHLLRASIVVRSGIWIVQTCMIGLRRVAKMVLRPLVLPQTY